MMNSMMPYMMSEGFWLWSVISLLLILLLVAAIVWLLTHVGSAHRQSSPHIQDTFPTYEQGYHPRERMQYQQEEYPSDSSQSLEPDEQPMAQYQQEASH